MVLEHNQYKEIENSETVYAINERVSRFNVTDLSSILHYEIVVYTDQQAYIFYCVDEVCSDVSNEG